MCVCGTILQTHRKQHCTIWTDDILSSKLKRSQKHKQHFGRQALKRSLLNYIWIGLFQARLKEQLGSLWSLWHSNLGFWAIPVSGLFEKCEGQWQMKPNSYLLVYCFSAKQQKDVFLLWHLHPTRETERRRVRAETWLSMRHNYTCSAKHETVLQLWAPGAGPSWPHITPQTILLLCFDSSQILSHCWGFGTGITAESSNGLWVNLDPCWYFLWRATVTLKYSTCQIVPICHPACSVVAQTRPLTVLRHNIAENKNMWPEEKVKHNWKCDIVLSVTGDSFEVDIFLKVDGWVVFPSKTLHVLLSSP